jgi:hypothetical protein
MPEGFEISIASSNPLFCKGGNENQGALYGKRNLEKQRTKTS